MNMLARILVCLAIVLVAGCKAKPAWQGRGDVLALYQFRTLSAEFPDQIGVPAVVASAEAALRSRGYAVTRSETTRDKGVVHAKKPNPEMLEKVVVIVRLSRLGTRVELRLDPFGDEPQSRAILDDMLVRLGY